MHASYFAGPILDGYFSVLIFGKHVGSKHFIFFRLYLPRSAGPVVSGYITTKWLYPNFQVSLPWLHLFRMSTAPLVGAVYLKHSDARCAAHCWRSSCASWEKMQSPWTIWRRSQATKIAMFVANIPNQNGMCLDSSSENSDSMGSNEFVRWSISALGLWDKPGN